MRECNSDSEYERQLWHYDVETRTIRSLQYCLDYDWRTNNVYANVSESIVSWFVARSITWTFLNPWSLEFRKIVMEDRISSSTSMKMETWVPSCSFDSHPYRSKLGNTRSNLSLTTSVLSKCSKCATTSVLYSHTASKHQMFKVWITLPTNM